MADGLNSLGVADWLNLGTRWLLQFRTRLTSWVRARDIRRIAIYGTGLSAELVIGELRKLGVTVTAVYHTEDVSLECEGLIVLPLSALGDRKDPLVLIASSRPSGELSSLTASIASHGARAVDLATALADEFPAWTRLFDIFPIKLKNLFFDQPAEFWDGYGTRWAAGAHVVHDGPPDPQNILLADAIRTLAPRSLLEVGCGTGRMLEPLARLLDPCPRLFGCDLSSAMLARCQNVMPGAPLLRADVSRGLPFRDHAFDTVFTMAMVQHIPPAHLDRALTELTRVACRHIIHWEHRWPNPAVYIFDHDLTAWYQSRGWSVMPIDSGTADIFHDQPDRIQLIRVDLKRGCHEPA